MLRSTQILFVVILACLTHSLSSSPVRNFGNNINEIEELLEKLEKLKQPALDVEGNRIRLQNVLKEFVHVRTV